METYTCHQCGQSFPADKRSHCDCFTPAKEEAERPSDATDCSRSLDVFESWEQFWRVKITGYTLRDGTDVCRFNFPSGTPNARTTDHMTLLINQGWQITAIHYENARALAQPIETSTEENDV